MHINPLSSIRYCLNNVSRLAPLIGIIALSIVGVTTTSALASSATRDFRRNINFYKQYYIINIEPDERAEQTRADIESQLLTLNSVDYFLQGSMSYVRTKAIVSTMRRPVAFLDRADMSQYLEELGLTLKKGNLPADEKNEITLTQRSAVNKNLKIGESFGNKIDSKEIWMIGEYKLTGTLDFSNIDDTDKLFQTGLGNLESSGRKRTTFFIHPAEGLENELHNQLQNIRDSFEHISVETEFSYTEFLDNELDSIGFILFFINLTVTAVVTVSAGLLCIIFLNQRKEEIGLLLAIGYSRFFITQKVFFEMFVQVVTGWIAGLGLTHGIFTYLNTTLFTPQALIGLTLMETQTIISSIPIPLSVLLFSLGFIVYTTHSFDPVYIIEKK